MTLFFERRKMIAGTMIALGAVALNLTGCTTTGDKGGATGGSGGATGTNVLRQAMTSEPTKYDPAQIEDGTTIDLLQQVFEGLVIWSPDNKIEPNLAEKWEVSKDGKTYTFTLRKGAKFHNGREVIADDFKYSIERACSKSVASVTAPSYLKDIVGAQDMIKGTATSISGIKVIDKSTLEITIDASKPYWLGNMTYPCAYAICKEEVEKNGGKIDDASLASLTGTGPFKFSSIQKGSQVSLVAFADYHGGKPALDGIERPIIKDASSRLNKFENGDIDMTEISPREMDRINASDKLKDNVKQYPLARIWYISMNADAPNSPFKNKLVRQAFAMAIDKDEAIRVGMQGLADKADGIVPPGVPGRNEAIKPIPFDPAKAKATLAQAGYPDGAGFPTITITFRNDYPQVEKTAAVIIEQLKKNLNVNIQPSPLEWGTFLAERTKKTMPFSHLSWGMDYLDPQNILSLLLHTDKVVNGNRSHPENGVGYANPKFDSLCDAADVEQDQTKRFALYAQAEQMAIDDAPWVPIYFVRDLFLIRPKVTGLKRSLFGFRPHVLTAVK